MTQLPPEGPLGRYEWPPLPVLDIATASNLMANRLADAWSDLEAERLRVIAAAGMGRKVLVNDWLAEFQSSIVRFMARVSGDTVKFIELHIGPRYAMGVRSVSGGDMSWTQPHTAALTSLATDTYGDFLRRAQEAQQVSEAFAAAVRTAAGRELPKIAAGGRTAKQAGDRLEERLLTEYGINHVTYRNGAKVPVRAYAHMAARTKSAVAYNAGTLNEAHQLGIGYVEVFDGPLCGWTSHEDTDKAARSIRPVQEAAVFAIAHPNCTRGFGARPDITSEDDLGSAKPFVTDAQQADSDALAAAAGLRARAPQTRAAAIRRARQQAQRQARKLGVSSPQDVGGIVRGILRDRGITP
jgi:hypothetical protein